MGLLFPGPSDRLIQRLTARLKTVIDRHFSHHGRYECPRCDFTIEITAGTPRDLRRARILATDHARHDLDRIQWRRWR
ncbi:hypothetical protein FHX42_001208 [Saccharopolyspora lacisalsi]|uniref:Uncharacterized protein n=1 Tax=Halosaccharopolyspora lacisalsi TaxID=1000566 RepID=A0A839DT02_9PSEU|nr:hypothetical protein [Halosaccharopolyspora lacisalsi]MBA8823879.1 hypothetical protein [Halosaccharopolyspora lacisalsi]